MKQFKIINNAVGWIMFAVAAFVYCSTIESTASFWDCPEFITTAYKLEIGHPPGAPFFMLFGNLFTQFASDPSHVAIMINTMSALLSAACILFLFWTITHLVRKLICSKGEVTTTAQLVSIIGSGVVGALAYTFSDTFWFSAVEGEVYAFSSMFTALVFWLILKWEDQADQNHSDRWLVLIAYLMGLSIGVHLLNLLCIPAIVLIFYYKKSSNSNLKGSLLALLVSFVIIFVTMYGIIPGLPKVGGQFELFFTNVLGQPYNVGSLVYMALLIAAVIWSIYESYVGKNKTRMGISFLIAVAMLGIPFYGWGFTSLFIGVVVLAVLWALLFRVKKIAKFQGLPRVLNTTLLCFLMLMIGYSSYALIVIRSTANPPMDQGSPEDVFTLSEYLNRDQYGSTPLFIGPAYTSQVKTVREGDWLVPQRTKGAPIYIRPEKTEAKEKDSYKKIGNKGEYVYAQNMIFPRIWDEHHAREYESWLGGVKGRIVEHDPGNGQKQQIKMPTQWDNLRFFFSYQLNFMYWRYFMWNFAGRQNDIQGMGEVTQGNWVSGIPFIDNPRLGDQSLLPDDLGSGNKGHNVFYLLPLLLGVVGLLWQAYRGKRGIEQFWVVFFLFFMTGIAIVMYLNQTPSQPRERDYAYAGSFYAYAIWIGFGVAGLWRTILWLMAKKDKKSGQREELGNTTKGLAVAGLAALIGLGVPLQMVSQTWDDHDRSGRYAARDFGMNYLASLEPNAVIFTNGDNDTFPLWYCQEVENFRTDVRVVNLSYLATDWYIAQMQRPAYESEPLPMKADKMTFAYDNRQFNYFIDPDTMPVPVLKSLEHLYGPNYKNNPYGMSEIKYPRTFIPIDADQAIKAGVVTENQRDMVEEYIGLSLDRLGSGLTSSQVMSLDIIASSIEQGWKRPCYFAMTVPTSYYLGLSPYLRNTGMAYQVTPLKGMSESGDIMSATDKMYDNVMNKFRWGGIDVAKPGSLYLDETVRRMVTTLRSAMTTLAMDLTYEGMAAKEAGKNGQASFMGQAPQSYAADRFDKAVKVLNTMMEKLPLGAAPFAVQMGQQVADTYAFIGQQTGNKEATRKAIDILKAEVMRYAGYVRYYQSLTPGQYDRLTMVDRFIDQRYLPMLIQDYASLDEGGLETLMNQIQQQGVNLDRVYSFMKASKPEAQAGDEVTVEPDSQQ